MSDRLKTVHNPIDIAFAKENCTGIQIHCLRCSYYEEVGFEGFHNQELVIDLPKGRNWSCPRCQSTMIETRPNYPSKGDSRTWVGLTKRQPGQ